jgi:hypothetical protein
VNTLLIPPVRQETTFLNSFNKGTNYQWKLVRVGKSSGVSTIVKTFSSNFGSRETPTVNPFASRSTCCVHSCRSIVIILKNHN